MDANGRECKTHEGLVEIERVRLPVTLTALIKITEGMPKGTTMRPVGDWMVFERKADNAPALADSGEERIVEKEEAQNGL